MKKNYFSFLGLLMGAAAMASTARATEAKTEPIQVAVNKNCLSQTVKSDEILFAVQVMPVSSEVVAERGEAPSHFERTKPVKLGSLTDSSGGSTISFTIDDLKKTLGPELKDYLVSALLCKGTKNNPEGQGSCQYPVLYRALTMKGNYLESLSENGQIDIQVVGDSKLACDH